MTGQRSAVVVGGGLAGITAALGLADAGWSVTLVEAKPRLGGLTASFRRGDLMVDTGQHVFMRCCTSYRGLLDRLGVTAKTTLQPRLDVPVIRAADGRRARIGRDALPVVAGLPLHLGRSLLSYRALSPTARLAAARAALALRGLDPSDPAVDDRSFGDWLSEHGQSREAVDALWDLVGVATLNARAADASLALAATVFQLGLLTDPGAADLGWSDVPLSELHGDAAAIELDKAGAQVQLRTRVESVSQSGGRWQVRTDDGVVASDALVIAVEPAQAERLLPSDATGFDAGWSERLGATPIVNVHAVFDRPVMSEPFLACVGSPLQWLFDRTTASGYRGGQYVAASLSAANDIASRPVSEIRSELLPEVTRVLPRAADADVVDFFVTREPHATFRQAPGSGRWRPATQTRLSGLVLAGAHTATGWPATMEGAVRSGEAAVSALLQTAGSRSDSEVAA